jgi:hypothetical protein
MVRDLRGTIGREGVAIGVLLTMHEPSDGVRLKAARAQFLSTSDAQGPFRASSSSRSRKSSPGVASGRSART